MKILHVIPSFAPAWRYGGTVTLAVSLTRELARQGHEVTVMTTNIDGPGVLDVPLERPVSMDGVDVCYFPVEHPRWYCFSRPLARALRQQVAQFDIVHIHSIFLWPTTIAAFWCRKRGVPYLISPHDLLNPAGIKKAYQGLSASMMSRSKKWLYLNTIGRLDLNRASTILFTTSVEMDAGGAYVRRAPQLALPLGADMPPPDESLNSVVWRDKYPILKDKKIVLFMSRLDPKKGLDILLAALGSISSRRRDFALVVAGSGDPQYESKLRSLVTGLGLQDITLFVGMVEHDDKWALLREADLFALPSHHEAFPNAVVEAMAAGLPVVVSEHVGISDAIHKAGVGLVTSLDPVEVESAIDSLLSDESLRRSLGEAGAKYVREHWSWEQTTADIAKAYDSIVRGQQRGAAEAVRTQTDQVDQRG